MSNNDEGTKCVTVVWKIKNFSHCLNKEYNSPVFNIPTILGYDWFIRLYPRNLTNSISLHLNHDLNNTSRRMNSDRTANVSGTASKFGAYQKPNYYVGVEFHLLTADGSPEIQATIERYDFSSTCKYSFGLVAPRSEVCKNRRLAFLENDVLSIKCCITPLSNPMNEDICFFFRSRICVEKFTFNWGVPNPGESSIFKSYTIPKTPSPNSTKVRLQWRSIGLSSEDEKIVLEIVPIFMKNEIFSICNVSYLDRAGQVAYSVQDEHIFKADSTNEWMFPLVYSKNKIMRHKDLFFHNVLNLQISYSFSEGDMHKIDTVYGPQSKNTLSPYKASNTEKCTVDDSSLNDALKTLYKDHQTRDFILRTPTKDFLIHQCILSARFPLMRTMIMNQNVLELVDLDESTFDKLILFMYTNQVGELEWDLATKLYCAADKYQIATLKKKCSSYMAANLAVSNACQALALANSHNDDELKDSVQTYMIRNGSEVLYSTAWTAIVEQNSALAIETIRAMHLKRNEDLFQQL